MKKIQSLGRVLSKSEQKKITGGYAMPPGGGDKTCSVSCSTGYYACCMDDTIVCKCVENSAGDGSECDDGGKGSTSCSVGTD